MNSFILMIPLLFVLYGQSFAQWEKTNFPSTAKVNTLAISDSNIFAGTDGDGIFVSRNDGESWTSINKGLQSKVVHTIFIKDKRIFAGTDSGASVSTNYGLSWDTINSGLSGLGVWSFAVSNNSYEDSTIFAGTWNGVYVSTNNGKSWEVRGLFNTTMPVHSIIIYDNFIYAATLAGGVFYSQSNGFAWDDISILDSDINSGITWLIPVYSLAIIDTNVIAGANAGRIYYTAFNNPYFTTFNPAPAQTFCFAIHNANIFAGNSNGSILLSENAGLNWKVIYPALIHQIIYSLALNNSYIFAGTGSGVWRLSYPKSITGVDNSKETTTGFALEQNYPNPFNPTTTIKYSITQPTVGNENFRSVQLMIYDVLGRVVAVLVNEEKPAGTYEVTWNAAGLPSGMYFYQLKVGNPESGSGQAFTATKKLLLLK